MDAASTETPVSVAAWPAAVLLGIAAAVMAGRSASAADVAAPAATETASTPAEVGPVPAPAPAEPAAAVPIESSACQEPAAAQHGFVDRMQHDVYASVCNTARFFDGFFGNARYDQDSDATFGRLGVVQVWDDRGGFDTKLRLRARVALPAMKNRVGLIFGQGEVEENGEEARPATTGALPTSFREVRDEAWLLGLGYSRQNGLRRGFDVDLGVRLGTPVDPFAKGSYRYNLPFGGATALRLRETLFWRDSLGVGTSTEVALDHLLTPRLLARWSNVGTVAEETAGLEWTSSAVLYQSLGTRRALSYISFVSGKTRAEVPLQNYGFGLRYRRSFWREWLFLELFGGVDWPREFREEDRNINPGLGLGVEMYFGDVPESGLR